jgi:hypothetical protein
LSGDIPFQSKMVHFYFTESAFRISERLLPGIYANHKLPNPSR